MSKKLAKSLRVDSMFVYGSSSWITSICWLGLLNLSFISTFFFGIFSKGTTTSCLSFVIELVFYEFDVSTIFYIITTEGSDYSEVIIRTLQSSFSSRE